MHRFRALPMHRRPAARGTIASMSLFLRRNNRNRFVSGVSELVDRCRLHPQARLPEPGGTYFAMFRCMCECCGDNPTVTRVSAMLMAGANPSSIRLAVCQKCRESIRRRDFETWQRIRALVLASQVEGNLGGSHYSRQLSS
jgi:hypothetical protein